MTTGSVLNIAFYRFIALGALDALGALRARLREECDRLGLKGTILLSPEGINGSLAATEPRVREFQRFLERVGERGEFERMEFKETWSEGQPFGRMRVRLKKEIISMGRPEVRPGELTGKRLPPEEFKRWLDEGREVHILDTRNRYEVAAGTFEGAIELGLGSFRQFPEKFEALRPALAARPVVMFCTGGIRCEKATALALQRGMTDVYQLEGGILRYFEICGGAHYRGDCFVFDEREALEPGT